MNLLGWSNQDDIKKNYYNICDAITSNEQLFNVFKTIPQYTTILEHVDYNLGKEYVDIVLNDYSDELLKKILDNLENIKQNDIHGSPLKYNYPVLGLISPTTVRYIKVLLDILSLKCDLNDKKVVEIGGGYGGQALILSKFFNFKSYTILDLESVNKLQNKYLTVNGVKNSNAATVESIQNEDWDFVISNYAFSELNKSFQDLYLNKVIKLSKFGYFQINPDASECYNAQELRAIFSEFDKPNFLPDNPMNRRYPNNFIFSFGSFK